MANYTVYEKQVKIVAHEVEAENEHGAIMIVHEKALDDYTYVVAESADIENVEFTEE